MTDTTEAPQQLALELPVALAPAASVPLQFRLNDSTRRRGLLHVAELRQQLAERQAAREAAGEAARQLPRRAA